MIEFTQILNEVNKVFISILADTNIILKEETTANDIEDWDSLNNVLIMANIEKHFNIKFTSSEIQKLKNVGALCKLIKIKIDKHL